MNLYDGYCYNDLDEVASQLQSKSVGDWGFITDVTVSDPNLLINYSLRNQIFTATITPPTCTKYGFQNSYTGVTTADAVEISGMVLLVLATVFSVKVIKRGF